MRKVLILAAAIAAMWTVPAIACTPIRFEGRFTYEGGDLATQLARRANTIQIVRVTSIGAEPLDLPQRDWLYDTPPRAFTLTVEETLAARSEPPRTLTAYGYDDALASVQVNDAPFEGVEEAFVAHPRGWLNVGALTDPAILGAPDEAGSGAPCSWRPQLRVGDLYVALSDGHGALYHTIGRGALNADDPNAFRVSVERDGGERAVWPAPSLIRVVGSSDSFVVRLREAIRQEAERR